MLYNANPRRSLAIKIAPPKIPNSGIELIVAPSFESFPRVSKCPMHSFSKAHLATASLETSVKLAKIGGQGQRGLAAIYGTEGN